MARFLWSFTALMLSYLSITGSVLADPVEGYAHDMMWSGGWVMGPLMMLFFVILLVAAIAVVLRWVGIGGGQRNSRQRALEILEERFARGEIDKAEFEERRRALKES